MPGAAPAPPRASPFEADRARKESSRKPEMSVESQPYSRAATAVALAGEASPQPAPNQAPVPGDIREAVLQALERARQQSVVAMLAAGEWSSEGAEVAVKVAAGAKFAEMAMNAEAKRVANEAATQSAGRPMRLRVLPGQKVSEIPPPRPANGGPGARTRAADEPVVRRMQEKFGAEIRTVIDHRNKR